MQEIYSVDRLLPAAPDIFQLRNALIRAIDRGVSPISTPDGAEAVYDLVLQHIADWQAMAVKLRAVKTIETLQEAGQ